jgi:hypothetical protein
MKLFKVLFCMMIFTSLAISGKTQDFVLLNRFKRSIPRTPIFRGYMLGINKGVAVHKLNQMNKLRAFANKAAQSQSPK